MQRPLKLFFASLLAVFGLTAQSHAADLEPSLDGDVLTLPVVALYEQELTLFTLTYRLTFKVVTNGDLIDLELMEVSEVSGVEANRLPSFFDGRLNLPALMLDGQSFWGEFAVTGADPITLRLQAADINKPGASGIAGMWRVTERVNAQQCDEEIYTDTYTLGVSQQGDQLTVHGDSGDYTGQLNGNLLQWSGSFPEDEGTVNTSIDITFTDAQDRFSGSSSWSWTGDGFSCSGTSQLSGLLLRN